MENLNLNEIAQFPIFDINIVELKCQIPGVITVLQRQGYFDFVFYNFNKGVNQYIFFEDYNISIGTYGYYDNIQMINIHGCATIDLTEFNNKTYNCEDFSLEYYSDELKFFKMYLKNVRSPYWLLGILRSPKEDDVKILLIYKEEYSINSVLILEKEWLYLLIMIIKKNILK